MKQAAVIIATAMLTMSAAMAEGHAHKAPHGGTLIELGDHVAHLELVLDAKTGKLTAYVLDSGAEKGVRLKQKDIQIKINDINEEDADVKLTLKAVANVLTGEKEGDSSEFTGQHEKLIGAKHFEGEIKKIKLKGEDLEDIDVDFPDGNEGGHDHKHDHKHDDHKHEKKEEPKKEQPKKKEGS
jgi:hypothetical protein